MLFLGVIPLLLASALPWNKDIILRVILIVGFLFLTTPVSSRMVWRAAYLRGERMHTSESSGYVEP